MDNEENKNKVHDAEIVVSSGHNRTNTTLGKFVRSIVKAGVVAGSLLKSKKVQKGLLYIGGIILKEALKMPRRDGTGPFGGGGPGSRRSSGRGFGGGRGRGGGNRPGAGPEGYCVCPSCGRQVAHQAGVPCYSVNCPNCGAKMSRG